MHLLSIADINVFSLETIKFYYIKKYRCGLHVDTWFLIRLSYFEFLKIVLIKMVGISMLSAKMTTLGIFKIKVFSKKGYGVLIFVMTSPTKFYHVTQIVL